MKSYFSGVWHAAEKTLPVTNPANGEIINTVPVTSAADLDAAIGSAEIGAQAMATLPCYRRFEILRDTAAALLKHRQRLAELISCEEGKTRAESLTEVDRSAETLELSGEEAKRLDGEQLPLEGGRGVSNKLGFTVRVPCGIVAAITPFNFPLNLVCHKVGPALAGGNAVILKPASDTPLVSLELVKLLLEAGLPHLGIACVTGSGSSVGRALCSDRRVRKISFTGSHSVGESICQTAGVKRITMELGSNSPMIVLPDADMDKVAEAVIRSGYSNAGQVCISAQRLIVPDSIHDTVVEQILPKIRSIAVGDPLAPTTQMGPMVRKQDAERVCEWFAEAESQGARLACGGKADQAFVEPTLILDATSDMKVVREELFGPAVSVCRARDADDAIRMATQSDFGLSAAIYTRDIDQAIHFAREVPCGNLHINGGPAWRTDSMPYGGLKSSGMGKEGPRYTIREMTEIKTVVIHG